VKLSDKQKIFALNVSKLISYIFNKGYSCTLGEAWRSPEQAEIYAKEGKGIVNSLHCKRLAIDLNLFAKEGEYLTDSCQYKWIGDVWKTLHPDNRWGGDFPNADGNHFEMNDK